MWGKSKNVVIEISTNHPDNGDTSSAEPGRTSLIVGSTSIGEIGEKLPGVWWENKNIYRDTGGSQVCRQ